MCKQQLCYFEENHVNVSSASRDYVNNTIFLSVLALTMALKDINGNNSILPNFELDSVLVDGQCKADMVMNRFIDIMMNDDYKKSFIGILGEYHNPLLTPIIVQNERDLVEMNTKLLHDASRER